MKILQCIPAFVLDVSLVPEAEFIQMYIDNRRQELSLEDWNFRKEMWKLPFVYLTELTFKLQFSSSNHPFLRHHRRKGGQNQNYQVLSHKIIKIILLALFSKPFT